MADQRRKELVRAFVLALWGMMTLVLLFTLGFLIIVMAQQQEELAALEAVPEGPFPPGMGAREARSTRNVKIYFAATEKTALRPETRRIEFTDRTVTNCRMVLEALIEGPRERLGEVLPPTVKIRGIYLLDTGELVVDFSRDLVSDQMKSATAELLMVQAVVTSLCQASLQGEDQRPVLSIRFLFEGSPAQNTFPIHLYFSAPIRPDNRMLDLGAEGMDNV